VARLPCRTAAASRFLTLDDSDRALALACVPFAIPEAERTEHFELARRLLTERAMERADLPQGYAFRFENEAFESVARFVANERKRCPFMTFELTLAPESGPIWLRMTGPEGTRSVLEAELNLAGSCSCK
jgi:hypothetical protein